VDLGWNALNSNEKTGKKNQRLSKIKKAFEPTQMLF
ncbi:hypothetical protein NT07LI_1115, partial [Listeria innocua FSL S4-378]